MNCSLKIISPEIKTLKHVLYSFKILRNKSSTLTVYQGKEKKKYDYQQRKPQETKQTDPKNIINVRFQENIQLR